MGTEDEVREVKQRYAPELLRQPGVCGVGVEKDESGNFTIVVHLDSDDPKVRSRLPQRLEGYPLKFVASGPFRKLSSA